MNGGRRSAAAWARAAIMCVVVYVAIDVVLVFLRPEFSVLHNAESDYGSAGHYGWLMNANFLLRCALSLMVVKALVLVAPDRLRTGLGWLVVWAVSSGLLAFFPDDPVGTPTRGLAAKLHVALALVAFASVIIGTLRVSRRLRREDTWRPVAPALSVLAWAAFAPIVLLLGTRFRATSLGGFWEKVFLAIELAWFLLAALWIARAEAGAEATV